MQFPQDRDVSWQRDSHPTLRYQCTFPRRLGEDNVFNFLSRC